MNDKQDCEIVKKGLCAGCVGLAEKDWVGKYQCKYYQQLTKNKPKGVKQICLF